jgi:hypothetical protein
MEHYAGADLHKRVTQLALLREGKPPAQFRFRNEKDKVEKALKGLPSGTKIAVEATGTWWWFVEQARALGHEVETIAGGSFTCGMDTWGAGALCSGAIDPPIPVEADADVGDQ